MNPLSEQPAAASPLAVPGVQAAAISHPQPESEISGRTLRWFDVALIFGMFVLLEALIAPAFAHAIFNLTHKLGVDMRPYPLPITLQIGLQETGILLIVALLALLRGLNFGDLGFRGARFYWYLAGIGLSVIALPIRIIAGLIAHFVLGGTLNSLSGNDDPSLFPLVASPAWAGVLIIAMAGGLVPLTEEIIFRGVFYGWLRKHAGVPAAVLISAAVFGMIHASVAMAVAASIMGIILALAYEYSKSLWVPIVLHALNNSALLVLLFFAVALQDLFGLHGVRI